MNTRKNPFTRSEPSFRFAAMRRCRPSMALEDPRAEEAERPLHDADGIAVLRSFVAVYTRLPLHLPRAPAGGRLRGHRRLRHVEGAIGRRLHRVAAGRTFVDRLVVAGVAVGIERVARGA